MHRDARFRLGIRAFHRARGSVRHVADNAIQHFIQADFRQRRADHDRHNATALHAFAQTEANFFDRQFAAIQIFFQ